MRLVPNSVHVSERSGNKDLISEEWGLSAKFCPQLNASTSMHYRYYCWMRKALAAKSANKTNLLK